MTVYYDNTHLLRPDPATPSTVGIQTATSANVQYSPYNAKGDGINDDTAAINLAIADAIAANSAVFFPAGTYYVTSTINFRCNVIALPGAIITGNVTPLVQIGDDVSDLKDKIMHLPEIIRKTKVWSGTGPVIGTDTGLSVHRVQTCEIHIPHVANFSLGIVCEPGGNNGCAYNRFFPLYLENNAISLKIAPSTTAWVNENQFHGGRYQQNSNEGTSVVGTKQIYIAYGGSGNQPNNNVWFGGSLEGAISEYFIDCNGGYNTWYQCRFEVTNLVHAAAVRWGANSNRNYIMGGYNAEQITQTYVSGSTKCGVWAYGNSMQVLGSGSNGSLIVENETSSASPNIVFLRAGGLEAGDVPSSAWLSSFGSTLWSGKIRTDAMPRIQIDTQAGKLNWGDGTNAPDTNIYRSASAIVKSDGKIVAVGGLGCGNSAAATTLGSVVKKMQIFDQSGSSLGFIPIYSSIT